MGTLGSVGIVNSDKTVTSIIVTNDMYPSYAGPMLKSKYNTVIKVYDLIARGGIAGAIHTKPKTAHLFSNGEDRATIMFKNAKSFLVDGDGAFLYLFDGKKWWVNPRTYFLSEDNPDPSIEDKWIDLDEALDMPELMEY